MIVTSNTIMSSCGDTWFLVVAVLKGLGCCFHICGLVLLILSKPKPRNQRLILLNLAVAEILYSILSLFAMYGEKYINLGNSSEIWHLVNCFCWSFTAAMFQFLVFYLATDKVMSVYLHLRYPVIFSPRVVISILTTLWFLGVAFSLVLVSIEARFHDHVELVEQIWTFCYLSVDALIVLSFVAQFCYLFYKVKKVQFENKRYSFSQTDDLKNRVAPRFMLPALIVATYVIFILTASVMFAMVQMRVVQKHNNNSNKNDSNNNSDCLEIIAHLLEAIAIITDALIYVFMQKQVRKYLKRLLTN